MCADHPDQKNKTQLLLEIQKLRLQNKELKEKAKKASSVFGQLALIHYKTIFDSISDAAIITDSKRRILSVNPAAEKLWGYRLHEIQGKTTKILYVNESDYKNQGKVRYHVGVEELREKYELAYKHKDGGIFYTETMSAKLETEEGDLIGFMGIHRDITARKKMEEALLRSKKEWELTFDAIADWVSLVSAEDFRILRSNLAGEKMLGLPIREIIGKTCWELVHGTQEPVPECPVPRAMETKERETSYIFFPDSKRWLRISVDPVLNKNGDVESLVHVASDITEQKKAEDHIRDSLREKEVLLREIHHRVKNNLQIISSLLRLQSDSIQDQSVREMFEISRSRIRSMALIHETLYRSQNFAKVKFSDYIRKLASHLTTIYKGKLGLVEMKFDLDDIFIEINRAIPCGLIVSELLSNSLRHAFPGNKKGMINVGFHQIENEMIKLTIQDNGIGMESGVTTSGSLGLQLVGDLVKQINGRILITQKKGTMFSILFPQSF